MKSRIIKMSLLLILMSTLVMNADAQRRSRNRNNANNANNAANNTGNQQQAQQNNNSAPSGYNPYGNVPIEVDSSGVGSTDTAKSKRNDNAFEKIGINERTPLTYEHLRWDDALFAEKVWRELDLREKMNMPFRYEATDDNGSQMFIDILMKAVQSGEVTAFEDERFTTFLSLDEVSKRLSGSTGDTTPVYDPNDINKVIKYVVTKGSFNPKEVTKIRMKEEWVFDREASRMFVRILGIAPVKERYNPNGSVRGTEVLFWVYYPDLRPTLARYEVYNPKNMGMSRMTWEELFESRMFSSYITKSTLDNPSNRNIRQMMKDQILALLEGDNIKERIFNYEQDLWSY
jgi:gliding motility associated protien GldN